MWCRWEAEQRDPMTRATRACLLGAGFGIVLGIFTGCERTATHYERSAEIASLEGVPPAPDFYEPSDYIAWFEDEFTNDRPVEYSRAYGRFRHTDAPNKRMRAPATSVRQSLKELADGPSWKPQDHADVDAYLDSVSKSLQVFKAAVSAAPGYRYRPTRSAKYPYSMIDSVSPLLSTSRPASESILALAWKEGPNQPARLLRTWQILLRHAEHMQGGRSTLFCRTAAEIRTRVYAGMRQAAVNGIISGDELSDAIRLLEEDDPGTSDLQGMMRVEWAWVLGFVQALYRDGQLNHELAELMAYVGNGGVRYVEGEQVERAAISPAELARAADEHFARLTTILEQPLTRPVVVEIEQLAAQNASGPLAGYPLRPTLQRDPSDMVRFELRALTDARATKLLLQMLRHRARRGRFPDTTTAVCADQQDCIDPWSDEPFCYVASGGKNAEGPIVRMLYSVGEDGNDNGGVHGDWSEFFGPPREGVDFVYWPPQGNVNDESAHAAGS